MDSPCYKISNLGKNSLLGLDEGELEAPVRIVEVVAPISSQLISNSKMGRGGNNVQLVSFKIFK